MLRRTVLKKICLSLFCLLILLILYLFPKVKNSSSYIKSEYTVKEFSDIVYLLDKNNYASRVPIVLRSVNLEDKVNELISYMTTNSVYSALIPNGFKSILPPGTKVISNSLSDGNLKVNFSKEFLNLDKQQEIIAIEALVYTLTSLSEVKSITIFVEGELLTKLPNSKEILPTPIDRSYGINKQYNIDRLKDITKTTIYYLSKNNDYYYYIPVTKVSNDKKDKIEIIIKELTSSPIYETNLMSYLNSETALKKYSILDKELSLDFNNDILSGIKGNRILEEVTYAINLSINDAYDVERVMYFVDDEKVATFDLKGLE